MIDIEVSEDLARDMVALGLADLHDDGVLYLTDKGRQVVDEYLEKRRRAIPN